MHGFPYQDSDFCGVYPMVTTENNTKLAQELVDELSQWIWDHRKESILPLDDLDKTMSSVLAMLDKDGHYERKQPTKGDRIDHTPIVIGDAADNPGGGAPGSGTHLLRAFLETKGLGKVAFISIHDPETAKVAVAAGVGATIDVSLGGNLTHWLANRLRPKPTSSRFRMGMSSFAGGPLTASLTRLVLRSGWSSRIRWMSSSCPAYARPTMIHRQGHTASSFRNTTS